MFGAPTGRWSRLMASNVTIDEQFATFVATSIGEVVNGLVA